MRTRFLAACMAAGVVALGAGAASASADTITFDMPFSGPVTNDCTGEVIAISGTMHFKQTSNLSLTGSKVQLETNFTGAKGTTITGVRYVMNDQISDMEHTDFDPLGSNQQLTIENSTILTRQGESGALLTGDDSRLHVLTHATVVDGVAKADKFDLRFDCQ
jgi:hypothetical protein